MLPLTDLFLRKLKSGEERIEVWDAKLPGFGVRVSPAGTKSFVLLYRFSPLPTKSCHFAHGLRQASAGTMPYSVM